MTVPSRPSGDREALVQAMAEKLCGEDHGPCLDCSDDAVALLAGPVGEALAQARAEALREAADALDFPGRDASGYYASKAHGGYREAERHAEQWLRYRADREDPTNG